MTTSPFSVQKSSAFKMGAQLVMRPAGGKARDRYEVAPVSGHLSSFDLISGQEVFNDEKRSTRV